MNNFKCLKKDLEADVMFSGEPVKLLEDECDVVSGGGSGDDEGSWVLDQLVFSEGFFGGRPKRREWLAIATVCLVHLQQVAKVGLIPPDQHMLAEKWLVKKKPTTIYNIAQHWKQHHHVDIIPHEQNDDE